MKVAIFDLDGTLVSSENAIHFALQQAFTKQGIKITDFKSIHELIGLPIETIIHHLIPHQNSHFYTQVIDDFENAYYKLITKNQHNLCYPHIKEQLALLNDKGWILAICTGKGRKGTEIDLKSNNIAPYFSLLKTASDGYMPKPNPQILKAAIAECGGKLNEAIMIGDTSYDIDMAYEIGVKSLAVSWGYHEKKALSHATDFIENPEDLNEKLEALYHA